MKKDKIYSFFMLLFFGWGIVLLQASPMGEVRENKVSEQERFTLYQIRERVNEIRDKIEFYKEDRYLAIQFEEEIETVEEGLDEIQTHIEEKRLEGKLYSTRSMNQLSKQISDINRAYWILESQ